MNPVFRDGFGQLYVKQLCKILHSSPATKQKLDTQLNAFIYSPARLN